MLLLCLFVLTHWGQQNEPMRHLGNRASSVCRRTPLDLGAVAVMQANEQEVAYAVANVVAFGLLGMLVYPAVAHSLFDTSEQVGLFLGTAIHDTAQVEAPFRYHSHIDWQWTPNCQSHRAGWGLAGFAFCGPLMMRSVDCICHILTVQPSGVCGWRGAQKSQSGFPSNDADPRA